MMTIKEIEETFNWIAGEKFSVVQKDNLLEFHDNGRRLFDVMASYANRETIGLAAYAWAAAKRRYKIR